VAREEQSRTFLAYDLLTGRVTPQHPLFPWLVRNGASPDRLASIAATPVPFSLILYPLAMRFPCSLLADPQGSTDLRPGCPGSTSRPDGQLASVCRLAGNRFTERQQLQCLVPGERLAAACRIVFSHRGQSVLQAQFVEARRRGKQRQVP